MILKLLHAINSTNEKPETYLMLARKAKENNFFQTATILYEKSIDKKFFEEYKSFESESCLGLNASFFNSMEKIYHEASEVAQKAGFEGKAMKLEQLSLLNKKRSDSCLEEIQQQYLNKLV